MAEASGEAEQQPQPSLLSKIEDGVLTEKDEKDTSVEEERETQNEQQGKGQKKMIKYKDQTKAQLAADFTLIQQRTQLDYSKEMRAELLENDSILTQEKIDDIVRRWSILNSKGNPKNLWKALNEQKQLCESIMHSKNVLINELQQELTRRNDLYVKNMRKRAEEMDQIIKKMEDQLHEKSKHFRELRTEMERVSQENYASSLKYITAWGESRKEQFDKEYKRRKKLMEDVEENLRQNLQKAHEEKALLLGLISKKQALLLPKSIPVLEKKQSKDFTSMIQLENLTSTIQMKDPTVMVQMHELTSMVHLTDPAGTIKKLEEKKKSLKKALTKQRKDNASELSLLANACKRKVQQAEHRSTLYKNRAVAEAKRLEDMQQTIEEKLKHLADRALLVDAAISKQVFGLSQKQEHPGSSQAQEPASNISQLWLQTEKCSQEKLGAACSLDPDTESPVAEMFKEKMVLEDSGSEWEEGKLSRELQKEEKKLLCNKPKEDSSKFKARMQSLGNVISEEKIRLWKEAERKLRQYHALLTEISDLTLQTNHLQQENVELKKQLQQRLDCSQKLQGQSEEEQRGGKKAHRRRRK